MRRLAFELGLALALASGAWVAADGLLHTWPLVRLPMWDAAGNGWSAVELWAALADGRLWDFVRRANEQETWPFGFSLLMLPFVAWGGGSFESATLLPAAAFALVPPLLVWLGSEIDRGSRGVAAGLAAGALWLASPLPGALATVSLRETAGAALGIAVLAAYLRARRRGTLGAWRLTAGLSLALLWTKYNYFLLGGTAVAIHAALEIARARRREIVLGLRHRILHAGWRQPLRWLAIAIGVSVVSLAFGQNPGNFLYAGLVVTTIVGGIRHRELLRHPIEALSRLSPPARAWIELWILPVWIWSLSPRPVHPHAVIAFLRNREGDLPLMSADSLTFYGRSLVEHYAASAWVGGAVAGLATGGLILLGRRRDPARALAVTVIVAVLALELHPMKQDRFLASVVPMLFLLATVVATRLVARWLPLRGAVRTAVAAALTGLSILGILLGSGDGGRAVRLERDHRLLTAPAELLPALTAAAFWASEPGAEGVAFLGGTNELSASAVRWEAWRGYGSGRSWVTPLRGLDGTSQATEIEARLDRWLARHRPRRIVALVPTPGGSRAADADYRRYNAWQETVLRSLRSRPAWNVARERRFPQLDFDLTVFDRHGE